MKKVLPVVLVGLVVFSSIGSAGLYDNRIINGPYDLLIIAPKLFSAPLQPLIDHKSDQGVATMLKTVEVIYDEYEGRDHAEQIKYCIKYAIETWDIKYVLLVGGRAPSFSEEAWLLPVRYSHIVDNIYTPEERFVSDLYFADIYDEHGNFSSWDTNDNGIYGEWYGNQSADDIIDLYPEVSVGRLPCRTKGEIRIMVRKIIRYERDKADDSWFKRMVVVGGDTYTDNEYYEGEVANQQALDWMTGFEQVKLWTSDGSFQSWKDVVRAINRGCGFIYFAGHGSPLAWGTHPPFDNATWIFGLKLRHIPMLWNGRKLPVCVVGGCHNSMFNVSILNPSWTFGVPAPECWSWWFTRKFGGGAIATVGCTGLGYGKEDKQEPGAEGAGDWLDVRFFEEYGAHGIDILGEVWGNTISTYLDEFPIDWSQQAFNDTALDAKSVQEWVLLGDPSLKIGGYE